MKPKRQLHSAWIKPDGTSLSHEEVKKIIESRTLPSNIYDPSIAGNTVAGAASITELTRALKNDVDLIYQFVYNNIDFYPMFGIQKGALGTLLDGMGGPWDQCVLMVTLLRQAGYTANYVFGQIQLTPTQLQNWLGTDPTDSTPSSTMLTRIGIPYTVNTTGGVWTSTTLSHIWVQVTIDGTPYVFDPSFKTYNYKTGIDLGSAIGYSQSTFLADAETGATITSESVTSLNRTNIRNDLAGYAANLKSYLTANMPTASLDDVLGGKTIVQNVDPVRQTSLPYEAPGDNPTIWTGDIPNTYRATLRVQFPGINQVFYSDAICHERLTITFNRSNQAVLSLNGTTVATGTAVSGFNDVIYTVTLPFNSFDEDAASAIFTGGTYLVGSSWGPCRREAVNYHKNILAQNRANGAADSSEPVLGEALSVQFWTWQAIESADLDFLGRMQACLPLQAVLVGIAGFDTKMPYFDLGLQAVTFCDYTGSAPFDPKAFAASGITGGGTEGKTIRHQYGVGDFNTNRVMDEAMTQAITVYDATSANWSSDVKPNLVNYIPAEVNAIETNWIDQGFRVLLPANGQVSIDTITDWGAFVGPNTSEGSFSSIVGFPSSLGGGTTIALNATQVADGDQLRAPEPGIGTPEPGAQSSEPIGLWQGNYLYDRTDISVGSGEFPYNLAFSRHYDSQQRFVSGPLGLGWSHNFNISASANTDAFQSLGDAGGAFSVPSVVALYIINDLMNVVSDVSAVNTLVSAMTERWMTELVTNNTVLISFPDKTEIFVVQSDGTYAPISNNGSTLSINAGAYVYKTKTGETFSFNTSSQITSCSWPNGLELSFTYQNGFLISVTNGLGRTLTFSHSGSYISKVSDGNGNTVSYSFDANGNLSALKDTLAQQIGYGYSSKGLLSQVLLPQNRTTAVVTNVYDTLGRVQTQSDAYSNVWTYYLAGPRSEEADPAGNARVLYFNRYGKTVRSIDQLSNETDTVYDGLNRAVEITMPEGNSAEYAYDSKSNVLSVTKVAKSGSGLANIVNSFTYDPTWNKVATAVDGNNNTTTFSYDPSTGNLLTIERPAVGGQTPTVTFTYNGRGQILTREDETGIVTQFNYDTSTEKLLSVVSDYGSSPHLNLTTSFGYDAVGNVTSVTDANSNKTSFVFDSERRLTQKTEASPFAYVTNLGYDENNNLTSIERQTGGTPAWQTYTIAYTVSNQKQSVTDPANNETQYQYDTLGRLWKVTDAESRTVTVAYDPCSRLYTVTDPAGVVRQTNSYTPNGRLSQVKDGNNNASSYSYDGFDRLLNSTYPDTSYEAVTAYDASDNALSLRTRSGNTIVNTFDVLNRLSTKSPESEAVVTLTYDLAGRLTEASTPVVAGNPASGNFQYFFDSAGRLIEEEAPDGKNTVYTLDGNGNVTKVTYPDGYYVSRSYDQLNRLTALYLNGAASAAAQFSYDELSRRTEVAFANGVTTTYTNALNNDLTGLAHAFVGSSVGFTMGFNNAHQMTSNLATDISYLWQPAIGTTSYGAANDLNQYPSVNGTSYSYDGNGNLTGDGTWTYTFDTESHLLTASKTGVSASYVYDPMHRQTEKTVGSNETRYFYSGWQRLADYDGSTGDLLTRYVYSDGLDEALIEVAADGTLTYLHADSAGSIIATTDSTGAVTNTNTYSEFGESAGVNGTTFGYAGQRYDSETGLYYSKNRYFSPTLGRFLQPDPIGYWGGLNTYAYVGNDPLNNADPLGLASVGTGNGTAGSFLHGSAQIDVSSDTFDPSVYLNQAEAIKSQFFAKSLAATLTAAAAVVALPALLESALLSRLAGAFGQIGIGVSTRGYALGGATYASLNSVAKGLLGQAGLEASARSDGFRVIATQVQVITANGYRFVADAILEDAEGLLRIGEAKFGYVNKLNPLSYQQNWGFEDLVKNGGVLVGTQAEEVGLAGTQLKPLLPYIFRTWF